MSPRLLLAPLALGLLCLWPEAGLAQKEMVFRKVTTDQVEAILKGMKIVYVKGGPGTAPTGHWFDYLGGGQRVRLTIFDQGACLWLSVNSRNAPLDLLNRWNMQARFSRAVLVGEKAKAIAIIENQLDVTGGVTEANIRQFISRFDDEVQRFDKFLPK